MKAMLAVSLLLALSACSHNQEMNTDNTMQERPKESVEASNSSADSIGANEASSNTTTSAVASNSSADSIGGNTATSDVRIANIEPEVEAMFEQLIKQAVAEGNDQKALRFVLDAEQAGSVKARDTYLEATNK
ncbi:hypothetical protein ACVFI8_03930 [Agarivorans sp. MS3-6]|uniref:hypothetical protein n=1 Tax=Agarivorans sp. TSD2052 TaxID=2937286 RepID=UPI00200D7907|nr:hypothetical protein [Agarivorans sp. TSD2052]UPW19827.1 hypothetical protein M0C34_06010 [Agarivorans sp. TSD2052]